MATTNIPKPAPIVFTARGLEIDTRLRVFDTVFHVHSTILKLHSQYFYKFLDSADKAAGTSTAGFKYDWVTKTVDGGKDWQLVCSGPNAGDLNLAEWEAYSHGDSDQHMQIDAFHNVLKAMYALPYILNEGHSIIIMTELARFYMCLPIISQTLDGAIVRSANFYLATVRTFPNSMLSTAVELRHKTLFNDALIWSLGPFENPRFHKIEDKKLKKLVQFHRYKLRSTILECFQRTIKMMLHDDAFERSEGFGHAIFKQGIAAEAMATRDSDEATSCTPRLLKYMCEEAEKQAHDELYEQLKLILRNDLSTGWRSLRVAGSQDSDYDDHFLLSTIDDDDDYPWDMTQLDW